MSIRLLLAFLTFAAAAPAFPALKYSTYLRQNFKPNAIATDSSGNIYLAGDITLDPSSYATTVLVVKMNPDATQYLYVRYVGGTASDNVNAIAVDSAGNAYIAGVTTSPDFPNTGANLATAPVSGTERSFVAKLNAAGQLVYSTLLGGSANSIAQAVAVNASGQAVVSGLSVQSGFPSTPGVYSVSDTSFAPFLLELDPTGAKLAFSATGIGGTSLALDPAGNIYVSGSTGSLTYPLTPGSYQPTFPVFQTCIAPCHGMFQGANQYVTKLDPTGSKMIYSTAVSGSGNTLNRGLAVDAAGNVYLTGLAGAGYPFTVAVPTPPLGIALGLLSTPALPFVTKLDPLGQKLLYSVPVGGLGVQVDANGFAYAGGLLGSFDLYDVAASLPALANIPAGCFLPLTTSGNSAYVAQVDASGNVVGSQFIGGSTLTISAVALSRSTLWFAGPTSTANFPFSPNAITESTLRPIRQSGAYLGAVDFSAPQPPAGTPQIGCVVDAATVAPVGPIVPYQLLTIFGNGLGPATPAIANDNATTALGGVSVSIGTHPAPLLYVSANQINVAVPLVNTNPNGAVMQIAVNGVSSPPIQFPMTSANPSVFAVPGSFLSNYAEFFAVALNADGSQNSSANPAPAGSVISVFVNGLSSDPQIAQGTLTLYSGSAWTVMGYSQASPFVLKVDLQVPSSSSSINCQPNASACVGEFGVADLNTYLSGLQQGATGGVGFGGLVYVAR
jgi:uncharacterized protein (TIGR03437 family)